MQTKEDKISSLNAYNFFIKVVRDLLKNAGWVRITVKSLTELYIAESNSSINRVTVSSYLKQMKLAGLIEQRFVEGSSRKQEIKLKDEA